MNDAWIADRMKHIDASGIRKAFEMAKAMKDPINLSIGLPDFDVAEPVKAAAIEAIRSGKNQYTVTQGIPELRDRIQAAVDDEFHHADRQVLITSGTAGALLLAICAVVNPGDEVIIFDPYFVMYRHQATLAGGTSVLIDTYPDFRIRPEVVAAAITPRTKCVVVNSPVNPDRRRDLRGRDAGARRALPRAERAPDQRRGLPGVLLRFALRVAGEVERGRAGGRRLQQGPRHDRLAHGLRARARRGSSRRWPSSSSSASSAPPAPCSTPAWRPSTKISHGHIEAYRRKRDMVVAALSESFELPFPEGAFYAFPRAPWGTATEFVAEAIRHNLLIIPGNVFSRRDTHFRISYAVDDSVLKRGLDVLRKLARRDRLALSRSVLTGHAEMARIEPSAGPLRFIASFL